MRAVPDDGDADMIRMPSTDELNVAIAWLRSNEGDNGESERCLRVANWIEAIELERYLRLSARNAGVTISALRKRLESLGARSKPGG